MDEAKPRISAERLARMCHVAEECQKDGAPETPTDLLAFDLRDARAEVASLRAELARLRAMLAAERAACAKLCDEQSERLTASYVKGCGSGSATRAIWCSKQFRSVAAAIRAREATP